MLRLFHQPTAPRGATKRRSRPAYDFDAWLNRVLDIATITALVVGGVALITRLI